jgi:hypothetical protein
MSVQTENQVRLTHRIGWNRSWAVHVRHTTGLSLPFKVLCATVGKLMAPFVPWHDHLGDNETLASPVSSWTRERPYGSTT